MTTTSKSHIAQLAYMLNSKEDLWGDPKQSKKSKFACPVGLPDLPILLLL